MRAYVNGEYLDMEEPAQDQSTEEIQGANFEEAVTELAAELASSETTSIAKIRAAAKRFLEQTGGVSTSA